MRDDLSVEWVLRPRLELISNNGMWNKFEVFREGVVVLRENGESLEIKFPVGWKTDVTSSPEILRSLVPQVGAHKPASILHDRLLDLFDRDVARFWLHVELEQLDLVKPLRKFYIKKGVFLFDKLKANQ